MARTTKSMMSFATHRLASGNSALMKRNASVATLSQGLVDQTIRKSGGTLRNA